MTRARRGTKARKWEDDFLAAFSVHANVSAACREARVGKSQNLGAIPAGRKVATHTLRHSAARHWLASGIPINVVSRWLGHASLQTTLIYLQILPDPLGDMDRVP